MAVRTLFVLFLLSDQCITFTNIKFFDTSGKTQIGTDWSVWFVPEVDSLVKSIIWKHGDEISLSCQHEDETLPPIEGFFSCSSGCLSKDCESRHSFGLRIDGSVFSLYVFNVSGADVGNYDLIVSFYHGHSFRKTSSLELAVPALFFPDTLTCNVEQFQDALRSTSATKLALDWLTDTHDHLSRRLEGEPIDGRVNLELGKPKGIAEAYLIRLPRQNGEPHFAPCNNAVSVSALYFTCLPCIDDVGLALIAFNSLNGASNLEQIKSMILAKIMKQFNIWLRRTAEQTQSKLPVYVGAEYRVIPLKIGWRAVVRTGNQIKMFCPLPNWHHSDGIVCRRTRSVTSQTETAPPSGFRIEKSPKDQFFHLLKDNASIADSGIYGCILTLEGVRMPVCTDRRLTVAHDASNIGIFIYKNLLEGWQMRVGDVHDQFTDDNLPFTVTNQFAYILCWAKAKPAVNITISLALMHTNPRTDIMSAMPFELASIKNAREGDQWLQRFHFFKFGGEGKAAYAGKVRATCLFEYDDESVKPTHWLKDPSDQGNNAESGRVASSSREIICMHGAEGSLWFEASVPQVEVHPVPLGTTVKCTGADGYPPPVYEWKRIIPSRTLPSDYAKYINLTHAPDVFTDSPKSLPPSMFQGNTITIPNDKTFRGMSFLFVCKAFNEVKGDIYQLERPLFISVCLCEERFVSIDLALIYSPQMLAGHVLLDERGQKAGPDFFGQRYIHLLRQVILGLAHGPNYARISTNPTSVLHPGLKRLQLYKEAMPFDHKLSRFQLANLFSLEGVQLQPVYASVENDCPRKLPVNLTAGMNSVEQYKPESATDYVSIKRPHSVVLPQDRYDSGDVVGFTRRIAHSRVMSVVFESSSSWAPGTPNYRVQLANAGVFGDKCSNELETDTRTFIHRLPLFDAICKEARATDTQENWYRGISFISPGKGMLYNGVSLAMFGVAHLNPFDHERYQMRICMISDMRASRLRVGRTTQHEIDSWCEEPVGISETSNRGDNCITISKHISVNDRHDGTVTVFYLRSTKNTQAIARFMRIPIRLQESTLKKPYLIVKQWPEKAGDSAEFECIVQIAMPPFCIALAYRPKSSTTYQILSQTSYEEQGFELRDINQKASARLVWPAVPRDAEEADIVCFVTPTSLSKHSLSVLPPGSSDPIKKSFISFCPQKPILTLTATSITTGELVTPRLGVRMTFVCEAMTGSVQNAPVQLAYADKSSHFVICSESGEGDANIKVPCTFATWEDGGCSSSNPNRRSSHEMDSFAHCSASSTRGGRMPHRRIEYTIPITTYDNFRGFAFCETLPAWDMEEDRRLLSNPVDNIFIINPTIRYLKVTEVEWACGVVSYPPPIVRTWNVTKAEPWNFRLGLSYLSSHEKNADYVPRAEMGNVAAPGFLPRNLEKLDPLANQTSFFDLIFPAPSFWRAGLYGVATMKCCVDNGKYSATCQKGYINRAYGKDKAEWLGPGRLLPAEGLVKGGESWLVLCPILSSLIEDKPTSIYLLGKVKLMEQSYMGVPLVHSVLRKQGNNITVGRKVHVGLWTGLPDDESEVTLVDDDQTRLVLQFKIHNALLQHSGRYACRAFFYNGYSDSDVDPEIVVVQPKASPIFGYKLGPSGWVFTEPPNVPPLLSPHQQVETRCLLWRMSYSSLRSTSAIEEPLLARSFARKDPYIEVSDTRVRRRKFGPVGHFEYHLLDYIFLAKFTQDLNKHLGCYWNLQTTEVGGPGRHHGPFSVCSPPGDLLIKPPITSHLTRSDALTCDPLGDTFPTPTIEWLYKIGPLPKPRGYANTGAGATSKTSKTLKISSLPEPGFYIFTCTASAPCNGNNLSSQVDVQFIVAPDGSKGFTTVNVSPKISLTLGTIHVECPSILSGLTAKHLTWFRLGHAVQHVYPEESAKAQVLYHHNLLNGTVDIKHPYLIAYQREVDAQTVFAIDIRPTSYEDSGFYGCSIEAFNPGIGMNSTKLSQLSSQPTCLVLDIDAPTLELKPSSTESCYREGEILSITCESVAYQGFCGDNDKPMGLRLFTTITALHISNDVNYSRRLNVASSVITGVSPPKKKLIYTPVELRVARHHNGARVTCETSPHSNDARFEVEWHKLEEKLSKRSSIKLCVLFPPSKLIIDPPPSEQVSQQQVDFVLGVGEVVSCMADGNPPPQVTMDAFEVKKGSLDAMVSKGLGGFSEWVDTSRAPPNWPTTSFDGGTGVSMTVKREAGASPGIIYTGICTARNTINGKEETSHKLFVFRIRDASSETAKDSLFHRLLFVAFLLAIFGFVSLTFIREFLVLSRRSVRTYSNRATASHDGPSLRGSGETWKPSLRQRRLLPPIHY